MKPAGIRPLTVSSSDESWTHVATRPHPRVEQLYRLVELFTCFDVRIKRVLLLLLPKVLRE